MKNLLNKILNDERLINWGLCDSNGEEIEGVSLAPFTTKNGNQAYMLVDENKEPACAVWEWDSINKLQGYSTPCITQKGDVFTIPYEI